MSGGLHACGARLRGDRMSSALRRRHSQLRTTHQVSDAKADCEAKRRHGVDLSSAQGWRPRDRCGWFVCHAVNSHCEKNSKDAAAVR